MPAKKMHIFSPFLGKTQKIQKNEKTSKKPIDKSGCLCYNIKACGGIAQLARASGSYPAGRWFKSDFRYQNPCTWPVGQAVKTPPFHGGNRSSILLRVTNGNKKAPHLCGAFLLPFANPTNLNSAFCLQKAITRETICRIRTRVRACLSSDSPTGRPCHRIASHECVMLFCCRSLSLQNLELLRRLKCTSAFGRRHGVFALAA